MLSRVWHSTVGGDLMVTRLLMPTHNDRLLGIQMVSLGLVSELVVHLRRRTKFEAGVEGEE
jgi:hypothetical protein